MDEWFSFLGLIMDAVGVTILTIDILPEYVASRHLRGLRLLNEGLAKLADGDTSDVPLPEKDRLLDLSGAVVAQVQASNAERNNLTNYSVAAARAALEILANRAGVSDSPTVQTALQRTAFEKGAFKKALAIVTRKLNAKYRAVQERRRPSLGWGIFLVVIGFALQAIGTVPDNLMGDLLWFAQRLATASGDETLL